MPRLVEDRPRGCAKWLVEPWLTCTASAELRWALWMTHTNGAAGDWYASQLDDWPSESAPLVVGHRLNSKKTGCFKISVMLTTAEMSCR